MQTEKLYYPKPVPELELHVTANIGWVLWPVAGEFREGMSFSTHDRYEADGYILDYLSLCNGLRSTKDIEDAMEQQIGPVLGPAFADKALEISQKSGFVELLETPLTKASAIKITGDRKGFFPTHSTFEIIETCNFTCDHCYYASSPHKTGRISLEDAIAVMDNLAKNGVRVIELTGGECTIHPDFRNILQYASDTFDLVAVISNGFQFGTESSELADFVSSLPNVLVQISIDGMKEWHDEFRKHKHAFRNATRAVSRFVKEKVPVRIACSISSESVDQIEPVYRLAKELGVPNVSFSPVGTLGRGCNISDPGAGSRELYHAIESRLAPFAGDPILAHGTEPNALQRNCGAGWRSVAVNYDGDVRACNYSRDSKKMGNVLHETYSMIFSQKSGFLFHNAMMPGGKECKDCAYFHNCRGCFVKAFMTSETIHPECAWRKQWFGDMSLDLDPARTAAGNSREILLELPQRQYTKTICSDCQCEH
ncbi:MAG: radical SAM protein [Gammaproteobacteria bacterium]|nr:radical SAM protein [Gammaproteobacteria bacterium]